MKKKKRDPEYSQVQLVEMAHREFDEAINELLNKALYEENIALDPHIEDKASRLSALGFGKAKPVAVVVKANTDATIARWNNQAIKDIQEAALYFHRAYPLYKFITEDQVTTICKKYGLLLGQIADYIGDVPDKNLVEIEAFKIKEEDVETGYTGQTEWDYEAQWVRREMGVLGIRERSHSYRPPAKVKLPMKIVAPLSDFDTMDKQYRITEDGRLIIKDDPIVLQPVAHAKGKGYLVVSKWGPEASDPLLLNAIDN